MNKHLQIFVTLISITAAGCTLPKTSVSEVERSNKTATTTEAKIAYTVKEKDANFYCPEGTYILTSSNGLGRVCALKQIPTEQKVINQNIKQATLFTYRAIGPFPTMMINLCKKYGGQTAETKTCEKDSDVNWNIDFTYQLRGAARCPVGTTHLKQYEICYDASKRLAYGPFKQDQVAECKRIAKAVADATSGSSKYSPIVCDSMRWSPSYFKTEIKEHLERARFFNYGVSLNIDKFKSVALLSQNDGDGCGRASIAMAVNYVVGSKKYTDTSFDIKNNYGAIQGKLNEFNSLTGSTYVDLIPGYKAGLNAKNEEYVWCRVGESLASDRPAIIGLNGPKFSPSGNGHILPIIAVDGDEVTMGDSAGGFIHKTTKQEILAAEAHPDGKFVFVNSSPNSVCNVLPR